MAHDQEHHNEYDESFVAGLEWMWGEGFLSPGGPAEVAEILKGVDLTGKHVLDIGCGIGGIDVLFVKEHGAAHVTGIDVAASLIERANETALRAGIADQVTFELVSPGLLPFPDRTFDVVFSKDVMIHIPDKKSIYQEIFRVLKVGGQLAFSDWFGSDELASTPEFEQWLVIVELSFRMAGIETAAAQLQQVGFSNIEMNDRNAWYRQYILQELATLKGTDYDRLVAEQGQAFAKKRLKSSNMKKVVIDQGLLRPGHIRAIRSGD